MGAMRRTEAGMRKVSSWVLEVESTGLFNGLDIQGNMNDEKCKVDSEFWPEHLSHEGDEDQTIPLLCSKRFLIL